MSNTHCFIESTLVLDNVDSKWQDQVMAKMREILEGLSRQASSDSDALAAINAERDKLRAAYLRFRELSELAEPKEERAGIAMGLLLNRPQKVKARKDGYVFSEEEREAAQESVNIPSGVAAYLDVSTLPLWKVIREIVRQAGKMRIVNLQNTLKVFGIEVRRQTIESSLKVHKKEFKTTYRGREKYVSLN
jgi:hypothetical protein